MIGIVIIAHGNLAAELHAAVEHVVGPQQQMEAVSIGPNDTAESRMPDLMQSVRRVDTGDGVVILTDMFGGTPSNSAISLLEKGKVEVLAGVNLPMLVKLAQIRDGRKLGDAVDQAEKAAKQYIMIASKVLGTDAA